MRVGPLAPGARSDMDMLDDRYLIYGLNALGRAHEADYFADGHRGAAVLSAYFLSREIGMEEGAANVVHAMVDENWSHSSLCAPFPQEPPDTALVANIVECARVYSGGLRQAGHNLIFPSLALKALRHLPEASTPLRIAGICRLIGSFTIVDDLRLATGDEVPSLRSGSEAAEYVLGELLECVTAFDGRGQGWSGHLLTFGRALLDLRELGYHDLAGEAERAFGIYVKRIRMGPLETDGVWAEHPPSDDRPRELRYWEHRRSRPIGLGHIFKYAYAYCGLMGLAEDTRLKQACRDVAYRVL